ncbi:MAG TPA: hypothetical protein PLO99_09030 [Chitinophagaceae bacterium]|nr:hypothetical protein [Chitinophagaceae bacterium]
MKKIFLILLLSSFFTIHSSAQTSKKDFVGYWTSMATEMVLWIDKNDQLQVVSWGTPSHLELEILSLTLEKDTLSIKTRFKEKNWVVTSAFTLVDEFNMVARISGDGEGTVAYKKIK